MNDETHIHIHLPGLDDVNRKLNRITKTLKAMAKKSDQINAYLGEINSSLQNLTGDLDRIASQIEGGLSPEEADSVVTQLGTLSTNLKALADRNPEPQTPPTEEPPVEQPPV